MRLRLALVFSSLAIALAPTPAGAKEKEKPGKKEREREAKTKDKPSKKEREPERPKTPPSLQLVSLDLAGARAVAIVGGVTKVPDSRLFSFHDDRDRHFIALNAECEPVKGPREAKEPRETKEAKEPKEGSREPGDDGEKPAATEPVDEGVRCELELPRGYSRRGSWKQFTVRVSGRDVEADPEAVKATFEKARAALPPEPPSKTRPRAQIRRGGGPQAQPEDPGMQPAAAPGEAGSEDEGGEGSAD